MQKKKVAPKRNKEQLGQKIYLSNFTFKDVIICSLFFFFSFVMGKKNNTFQNLYTDIAAHAVLLLIH